MSKWDEMTERERDAWVAEHVMSQRVIGETYVSHDGTSVNPTREDWNLRPVYVWNEETAKLHESDEFFDRSWSVVNGHWIGALLPVPDYTADASSDYLVLCTVREEWGTVRIEQFAHGLYRVWTDRDPQQHEVKSKIVWLPYQPGDYSHAAYLALEAE